MLKKTLAAAVIVVSLASALSNSTTRAQQPSAGIETPAALDQPLMKAARNDLKKALSSLRRADTDKGGHRIRAMNLVSQAIAEVDRGIAFDHTTPGDRRRNSHFGDEDEANAAADQPRMQQAKERLQAALANLQRASTDKGGHRLRAMELTRAAIVEVNKGIAFDRRN